MTGGSFDISKLNENGFMDDMRIAIKDLNNSYVFHRKGSAVTGQLTVFQGLFNKMLGGTNEIKDIIYIGANSPKDAANSALYSNATEKVEYLVKHIFQTDAQIKAASLDVDAENHRLYFYNVDVNATGFIVVRMNPNPDGEIEVPSWDAKWNQSGDLSFPEVGLTIHFTVH